MGIEVNNSTGLIDYGDKGLDFVLLLGKIYPKYLISVIRDVKYYLNLFINKWKKIK